MIVPSASGLSATTRSTHKTHIHTRHLHWRLEGLTRVLRILGRHQRVVQQQRLEQLGRARRRRGKKHVLDLRGQVFNVCV